MMGKRPTGTVTFLFTDIEGSTRRWEVDRAGMTVALAAHDEVLRVAIERSGGWLFKHTGDGVCAAFSSAPEALTAAIEAQRGLTLPVRMGLGTGTADLRGDDYFGPVLNRAARVMAVGHGGQILASAATAALADGFELVDLGQHVLRDLPGFHRVFQVCAEGIRRDFPAIRTLRAGAGGLPTQTTSFVGRREMVEELVHEVRGHRLVTLTGVGGVGKTRLALQVAAEIAADYPEGIWLIELAPVGEAAAVPDSVATALGVHAGPSVTDSIVQALFGRQVLIVLDNCEHLLDAAAELVETIIARTTTVTVLATSREGLRVGAERVWPVPPMTVSGESPEAVALFVARAQAVNPGFSLERAGDARAAELICQRLDGIPLAVELAAARMVSMSPQDVLDRLSDRFRLLAGSRRGVDRHQTLRQAVAWSYELLGKDERWVLCRCGVFAGGFDLAAATHLCHPLDEYVVLDALDSLVRKSLVTAGRQGDRVRYWMLETLRQFTEERLVHHGEMTEIRDRHARYYAGLAADCFHLWDGPGQREAYDQVDAELANLRAGFRWAADHDDVVTATSIAANATMVAWSLLLYEPIGWAEEILNGAIKADIDQLPLLYTAASLCLLTGRPEDGVRYSKTAIALEADARYRGLPPGIASFFEAASENFAGRIERSVEILARCAVELPPGTGHAACAALHVLGLALAGRPAEAMQIADQSLAEARAYGNPVWVGTALYGLAGALAPTDPVRALTVYREGLDYCQEHRILYLAGMGIRDAAWLETLHGDTRQGLELFESAIDLFYGAGDHGTLSETLAKLAVCLDDRDQCADAATLVGANMRHGALAVPSLPKAIDHMRTTLGEGTFEAQVAIGKEMDVVDAVTYARGRIRHMRQSLAPPA
jgi:predicted ATPase/class 3 adenylate cyclase